MLNLLAKILTETNFAINFCTEEMPGKLLRPLIGEFVGFVYFQYFATPKLHPEGPNEPPNWNNVPNSAKYYACYMWSTFMISMAIEKKIEDKIENLSQELTKQKHILSEETKNAKQVLLTLKDMQLELKDIQAKKKLQQSDAIQNFISKYNKELDINLKQLKNILNVEFEHSNPDELIKQIDQQGWPLWQKLVGMTNILHNHFWEHVSPLTMCAIAIKFLYMDYPAHLAIDSVLMLKALHALWNASNDAYQFRNKVDELPNLREQVEKQFAELKEDEAAINRNVESFFQDYIKLSPKKSSIEIEEVQQHTLFYNLSKGAKPELKQETNIEIDDETYETIGLLQNRS